MDGSTGLAPTRPHEAGIATLRMALAAATENEARLTDRASLLAEQLAKARQCAASWAAEMDELAATIRLLEAPP